MDYEMQIEWADNVQSVYDQMDEGLQELIFEGLKQLGQKSFLAYQRRPEGLESIDMVSHLQIPKRDIWLEITSQCYVEDQKPILLVRAIKESSAIEAINRKSKSLEELKKIHIDRAYKMMDADVRNMYPFDLFATAVYKRSMSLIDGFLKMIPSNFICAAPLVRLQVDNLLRLYAANRVNVDIHEFALDIMRGKSIKDMRDKDSPKQKLTDAHLVQKFKHLEPSIVSLYKETSGYIHLSEKHIYSSINVTDKISGKIQACVSEKDQFISDGDRVEALTAMTVITEKLLWLLDGWTFVKSNPEIAKEAWNRGEELLYR